MRKFCQFQTELSAHHTSVFSFLDDDLSKCQWIFTKLGMCIDIEAIWFGLQMGKLHQLLTELSAPHMIMAGYYHFRAQLFEANDIIS